MYISRGHVSLAATTLGGQTDEHVKRQRLLLPNDPRTRLDLNALTTICNRNGNGANYSACGMYKIGPLLQQLRCRLY